MTVQPGGQNVLASTTAFMPTIGSLLPKWVKIIGSGKSNSRMECARDGAHSGLVRLNVTNIWRSRKRNAAAQTLVADQQGYDLPADFYAAHSLTLLDKGTTVEDTVLEPVRDLDQQRDRGDGGDSGRPTRWYIKDGYSDKKFYLDPPPEASAVSDFDVRLTYYTRIPTIVANGTQIDMQEELELFLEYYVKWYLLTHFAPERAHLINAYERQWREVMALMKTAEMDEAAHEWQIKVDLV